jgi:hypothetical protein
MTISVVKVGNYWHYVRGASFTPLIAVLVLAPLVLLAAWTAARSIDRHEVPVLVCWFAAALIFQGYLDTLSLTSLTTRIDQDHFNQIAQKYGALELLRDYQDLAPHLPLHGKANMPGKVLLYEGMRGLTRSPRLLGYFVMTISAMGGVVLYIVARQLYRDRRAALYAMILYFCLPTRLVLLDTLNVVTPVFAIGLFFFVVRALETGSVPRLLILGVAIYGTLLFEPSPLILLPLFLVVGAVARDRRLFDKKRIRDAALVLAGFVAVHGLMLMLVPFDVFEAARHVFSDARAFNQTSRSIYVAWLLPNLREFFVNSGLGLSLLMIGVFISVLVDTMWNKQARLRRMLDPALLMLVGLVVVVCLVDLMGVNRGEVSRLWIYLGSLLPLAAGGMFRRILPRWSFYLVACCLVVQATFLIYRVQLDFAQYSDLFKRPLSQDATYLLDAYIVGFIGLAVISAVVCRSRPPDSRDALDAHSGVERS